MDTFKQQGSINDNVEKSIRKKFHKALFSRFAKAINEYRLLEEGDKAIIILHIRWQRFNAYGKAFPGA